MAIRVLAPHTRHEPGFETLTVIKPQPVDWEDERRLVHRRTAHRLHLKRQQARIRDRTLAHRALAAPSCCSGFSCAAAWRTRW
jgi:hypothetical protein